MERVAIYYRVSTDKQELASQKHAVEKFLAEHPKKPKKTYVIEDEGFSGKDHSRPGFRELMRRAMAREIDTIVVYRLDRFSRDANVAIRTLLELDQYGVAFISVTQPVLNLGHDMPFRRTLLAAFAEIAELERETIVARVRSGLEAARKKGKRLGAPVKLSADKQMQARILQGQGYSMNSIAKEIGLSVGSVHRLLKGKELGEQAPQTLNDAGQPVQAKERGDGPDAPEVTND